MRLFCVNSSCFYTCICHTRTSQQGGNMGRGPSAAVVKAIEFSSKNPTITAPELAKKFGLNESTVYRSTWYKNRSKSQPQGENK